MAKVSCRKAICARILELARQDPRIWAVCTDSRGSVTIGAMAEELPEQFVELGIAEQNAVAVAAGLALTGKTVFACGPACFLAARAYEQVKVDVAYNCTDVKILGVSAGVSYGPLGCTHTSLHDVASMRSLPNLEVIAPSDAVQARAVADYLVSHHGPAYVRMGRGDVEAVYGENESFEMGKVKTVREGTDVTLIACGEMVWHAKEAAFLLEREGISARVLDFFFLKPADEDAVRRAARETGAIVTVEEHSVNGGLGELVTHTVCAGCPVPVRVLGFPDEETLVGKSGDLFRHYGLTAEHIAAAARGVIAQKEERRA